MKTTDFIKESIGEDADNMHRDHEVQMARSDCYNAARYAIELHKMLHHVAEQQGLEGWVSEKITLANDYLRTVWEYLRHEGAMDDQQQPMMPMFSFESAEKQFEDLLNEDSQNKDMTGQTCEKCKRGKYQDTSIHDDMDGVLHCTKCGTKVDRWRKYKEQGVAEGSGNIGASIKALCQKIYNAGDDEFEYFYNDSPIFAQYWDEYEGDLDSIIAEVDPKELRAIRDELKSYVQQANLAEGEPGDLEHELEKQDYERDAQRDAEAEKQANEAQYDRGDYYSARTGGEYGKNLTPSEVGGGGEHYRGAHKTSGFTKKLPADPFGRTTGKVPASAKPKKELDPFRDESNEGIDFDQLRRDAAANVKSSIDKQSDARIAGGQEPKKGFWQQVGDKQIGMVKGAVKGAIKGFKGESVKESASVGGVSAGAFATGPTAGGGKPGTGKPKAAVTNAVKRTKLKFGKGIY